MTQMSAAQIRQQAMALLAQAEQVEAEQVEAEQAEAPAQTYEEWVWETCQKITDPLQAWAFVADTWDQLDGDQTLAVVGQLAFALAPQEQEPAPGVGEPTPGVEEDEDYLPPELAELAAAAEVEQQAPAPAAPVRTAAFGKLVPAQPAVQRVVQPPPAATEPPPRGMKVRAPNREARAVPTSPTRVVLNEPLKQGAPRSRTRHEIPAHLQQWRRDGSGRMVPANDPVEE